MVSVIIPVYNVEKYLEKCLDSVLSQTFKNLEIILVDDGSTDGSSKIIDTYSLKDSRIKVIHKENGGVSSARNKGLEVATGEYVCFIDSDDIIEENFIEELFNELISSNSDISMCPIRWIDETVYKVSELENEKVFETKDLLKHFFVEGVLKELLYAPWNKLFNRSILKDSYFNTNYALGEDILFVFEVLLKSNKLCFTNKTSYGYIQRYTSAMHTKSIEKLLGYISATEDIYNLCIENKLECSISCFAWRYKHILNLMVNSIKNKQQFSRKKEYYNILKYNNPLKDIKSNLKRIFVLVFGA